MKKILAIILVLIFAFSVAACAAGETTQPTPTPADETTPATDKTDNNDDDDDNESPLVDDNGDDIDANDYPLAGIPVRIGAITSLSGALQDYGEQFQRGFNLGLEYMTNGTNTVAGRPIEVIWEDTTNVPEVARERTLILLENHEVEIVTGFAASGDAVASLALFEEFETVAIIEPAAADAIISEGVWNEFVFRTGRTSGQDALAMMSVLQRNAAPGATVGAVAPDTTFGHAMVDPFISAVDSAGFDFIHAELIPADATDFTPFLLRVREIAPDYLYLIWAGANNPWAQLMELDLISAGITLITGAPELAALQPMLPLAHAEAIGFCVYHHELPQAEPMNDWLVERHFEVHGTPPDIFTSGGMAAASAIITALELTNGETDHTILIPTLQGMEFNSPTGMRHFRPEDGQAIQNLFEIQFEYIAGREYAVPRFVRVIPPEDMPLPVMNGR